MHETS